MLLYRYVRECSDEFTPALVLSTHEVIRETKSCYVIKRWGEKPERFILKDPNGKRWAYDTKEKALENFRQRTLRSISIARMYLKQGEAYLKLCETK